MLKGMYSSMPVPLRLPEAEMEEEELSSEEEGTSRGEQSSEGEGESWGEQSSGEGGEITQNGYSAC